ncbi:hypothetical protein C8R45DRAFT_1084508, partial [Mycena sanguinolenta]
MGLLQISVDIDSLFHDSEVDFRHFAFARLTHLDLINVPTPENWATDICNLPCLTHLSFNFDSPGDYIDPNSIRLILTHYKTLEVLVFIFSKSSYMEDFDAYPYFSNDPRAVTTVVEDFLGDWEKGAVGRDDYWFALKL